MLIPTPRPADQALSNLNATSVGSATRSARTARGGGSDAPGVRRPAFESLYERALSTRTSAAEARSLGNAARTQNAALSSRERTAASDAKDLLTKSGRERGERDPGIEGGPSADAKGEPGDAGQLSTNGEEQGSAGGHTSPSSPEGAADVPVGAVVDPKAFADAAQVALPTGAALKSSDQGVAQQARHERGLAGQPEMGDESPRSSEGQRFGESAAAADARPSLGVAGAADRPSAPGSADADAPGAAMGQLPSETADDRVQGPEASEGGEGHVEDAPTSTERQLAGLPEAALGRGSVGTSMAATISALLPLERAGRSEGFGDSGRASQEIWSLAPALGPRADGVGGKRTGSGGADGSKAGTQRQPTPLDAQLAEGLAATLRHIPSPAGQRVVTMRLDPAELGRVRVHMRVAGEVVSVRFQVGTQQARAAVEKSQNELRQSVERRGLRVDSFTVETIDELAGAGSGVGGGQDGNVRTTGDAGLAHFAPASAGKGLAMGQSAPSPTRAGGAMLAEPGRPSDEGGVLEHLSLRVDARG